MRAAGGSVFGASLVDRHVGEAEFVVQFLLSHIVRADMSDHLADYGLLSLLLAASGEQHRRRQNARNRSDAPQAPRLWRYVQQAILQITARRRPDAGLSRNHDEAPGGRQA